MVNWFENLLYVAFLVETCLSANVLSVVLEKKRINIFCSKNYETVMLL